MAKNIIFILLYFIYSLFVLSSVYAMNPNNKKNRSVSKIQNISSPNWVHPNLRKNHQGYEKLKAQKTYSPIWQYNTNRPSGNIKGGGTTKYKDYTPFYHPSHKYKKKE